MVSRPVCLDLKAGYTLSLSLELSDTAISADQAASSETLNVKIAGDKATKTRSNFSRSSAQTEQKHTTMTFVWFPDHVLWHNVS